LSARRKQKDRREAFFLFVLKIKRSTEKKSAIMLQCMSLLLADFVAEVGNYQREGPTRTS